MPKTFTSTIKWIGNLTKVFLKNAPGSTVSVVLMTLVGQLAMILSFLLPLKVVMLLGSENIPGFIPSPINQLERDSLILLLVGLALIFYTFHTISSKISQYACRTGVKKLLAKTHKIILFENQDALAAKAYSKYAEALASLTFSSLAITSLCLFYSNVGSILISYIFLCLVCITWGIRHSSKIQTLVSENSQQLLNGLNGIGFMMIFIFIVIDFLYLSPPNFITALVAIILSRLLLVRLNVGINHILFLTKQHNKINALFFHDHAFIPMQEHTHRRDFFGGLLEPAYRAQWIKALVKEATGTSPVDYSETWLQTEIKNTITLKIDLKTSGQSLMIKLFDLNKSSAAQHEATLLLSGEVESLPHLPLLLTTKVSDYHCHIFDMTGYRAMSQDETAKIEAELFISIMCSPVPQALHDRYCRSKMMIWDELTTEMFERLSLIASTNELAKLNTVSQKLPEIVETLKSVPICIMTSVNKSQILISTENWPVLIDWGSWKIEPAFSSWKEKYSKCIHLGSAIQRNQKRRQEFREFSIESYKTVVVMSNFIDFYRKGLYKSAVKLLNELPDLTKTKSRTI